MSLNAHLVMHAASGVLAERLNVDIATAERVLTGYAERRGRPPPELAAAVTDRSLALEWIERPDGAVPDPGPPPSTHDVLYIEDDEANLALMRRLFGRWPTMHLDTTITGATGLEHIRRHPPDLVLLDGNLPDLDGGEVLRQIRDDPATADLPVIVLSADHNPGRVAALLEAGANEYVTKPFAFDHLDDLVTRLTADRTVALGGYP